MSEKLDFSNPDQLQTRDGRQVRIYATDGCVPFLIHGAVLDTDGWTSTKWKVTGHNRNDEIASRFDIICKPARMTGWFNVSADGVWYVPHPTLEAAREYVARGTQSCAGQIYIDAEIQT